MMGSAREYSPSLPPSPYGPWTGLPESIAADLFGHAELSGLKPGEVLFEVGESGNGFYLLDKGLLKVVLTSFDNEDVIIALLTPGTIVGDLAVIDEMPRAASVVALLECKLRFVSKADFERCCEKRPDIYQCLARILASRLREANECIAAHTMSPVKARIARALLQVAEILGQRTAGGIAVPDAIRQRDIAAMAGVARETVNRILHEWERTEIVTKMGHCYLIADIRALGRELLG